MKVAIVGQQDFGKAVLEAFLARGDAQHVRPRAFLLGRAEHGRYLVAAGEERFQHGLAEILLADDGDSHAAFLGGTENAPASFNEPIFASS